MLEAERLGPDSAPAGEWENRLGSELSPRSRREMVPSRELSSCRLIEEPFIRIAWSRLRLRSINKNSARRASIERNELRRLIADMPAVLVDCDGVWITIQINRSGRAGAWAVAIGANCLGARIIRQAGDAAL